MPESRDPQSLAEELFAECVLRSEEGAPVDFEAVCSQNAELAGELRILHDQHRLQGRLRKAVPTTAPFQRAPGAAPAPRTPAASEAGSLVVPGFRILRLLGQGGMGAVYEAEQAHPRRRVALKVMRLGFDAESLRRRFQFEVEALGRLHHPAIAQVYETGTVQLAEHELPWFTMEFVESGRSLTSHARDERLGVRERLGLFATVCDAIHYGHQRGILHRDLKPGNVLVDGEGRAKVIDFGIARAIDGDLTETRDRTQSGHVVGTLMYMSPEQLGGGGDGLDVRCDVYALGMILYELLTDAHPYGSSELSLPALVRAIRLQDPRRPSTDSRGLSRDLDLIVLKALSKEPEERYSSAEELAADVRRFLRREPVAARPPSWVYRTRMFARRNPAVSAAMGLGLVALTVILGLLAANLRTRTDFLLLAALQDAEELVADAEGAWPPYPERIGAYRSWIEQASALAGELPGYRAELRSTAAGAGWQRLQLTRLIERLEVLADERTGLLGHGAAPPHGWAIGRRLEAAERLAGLEASVENRAAWRDATAAIRDHPAYGGLVLRRQTGLVPLGPDPGSGLWEFAHVLSGRVPERSPDTGRLLVDGESALVFVLVPGGSFVMGAQADDPNGLHHDPAATPLFGPPHEVLLDPFFLSKYEATQGQWSRLSGHNPSYFYPGWNEDWLPDGGAAHPVEISLLHPVESVSWDDSTETLRRFGLTLPTEAQWERATRGGTDTPWYTGASAEEAARASNMKVLPGDARIHEEVGRRLANPFGLHNVIANVREWCLDGYGSYASFSVRPGTGERIVPRATLKVTRGAGSGGPASAGTSARRHGMPSNSVQEGLGVRPARLVGR